MFSGGTQGNRAFICREINAKGEPSHNDRNRLYQEHEESGRKTNV